jgi:hypothetical protein
MYSYIKRNEIAINLTFNKLFLFFCVLVTLLSCKKEVSETETIPLAITPKSIAFVYEDGSEIKPGSCINPSTNYAIAINATISGVDTSGKGLSIKYSFNSTPGEVTFFNSGVKIVNVKLVNGTNLAQITGTKQEASLIYKVQEFELVE